MRVVRKELVMRSIERLHMQWSRVIVAIPYIAAAIVLTANSVPIVKEGTSRVLHEPENEPVKSTTRQSRLFGSVVEFSMPGLEETNEERSAFE